MRRGEEERGGGKGVVGEKGVRDVGDERKGRERKARDVMGNGVQGRRKDGEEDGEGWRTREGRGENEMMVITRIMTIMMMLIIFKYSLTSSCLSYFFLHSVEEGMRRKTLRAL